MGKGSSKAPSPDPNIGRAALLQAETGEHWLAFAKGAFDVSTERQAELDALTKQVTDLQLGLATDQLDRSRKDRERYEQVFKPIEDEFVEEAANYASPERQAQAAAEAKADVQSAAAVSKQTAQREAEAYGINPASGRHAGIRRAGELGTALATAGAANTARTQVRDKGLALKADAINLGRGLPSQSAQAASLGLGAGSGAVGLVQGNQGLYNASTGIMSQGFQGAMSGYAGMGSTLNTQYANQINAWEAQQRASAANAAGIGQVLGTGLGLIFSDEDAKEQKKPIPEGDALDAVNEMPVEEWTYKEGVADEGRHVGPYAQDFKRATGKGDGKAIAVQDAIGITMKAVQDLDQKVERIASAVGLGGAKSRSRKQNAAEPQQQPMGMAA